MDLAETPDPPSDADPEPESNSSSASWLQILANYATLLVAVSAVVLSVWQGYEMRKHNRLSVLPNLEETAKQLTLEEGDRLKYRGTQETVTEPTYVLKTGLENTGLGPAVFKNVLLFRAGADTILYQTRGEGEAINITLAESFGSQARDRYPELEWFIGGLRQGTMMKAGDRIPFLEVKIPVSSVPDTLDGYPPGRLRDMIAQYSFVVCYCSVYGEDCDREAIGAEPPSNACEV